MEFLRFGSSIPGSYWGCCAIDIIQNFKVDPDAKASIECVSGDGGYPLGGYIGQTWREIFEQRMRIATFNTNDMPNHMFLASLTAGQCISGVGLKWLKILHEHGFEFLRCVSNSVYTGASLAAKVPESGGGSPVYLFGLFRNIGAGNVPNMFEPPKSWKDLGGAAYTEVNAIPGDKGHALTKEIFDVTLKDYKKLPPKKFWTTKEVDKEIGEANRWRAGLRSPKPQEKAAQRKAKEKGAQAVSKSAGQLAKATTSDDPLAA